jgi:mono/diheme cytochrome c family protein
MGIRTRAGVSGVAIATTAALMVSLCIGALGATALLALTVWDGVYTEEQASRGRTLYEKECAGCHLDTLQGDGLAPGLVADSFTYRWQDGPVSDLFIVIKATMPADRPSALQDQEYSDIIAYLLKKNHYPSGSSELSKNQADLKEIGFKKAGDK